MTKEEIREASSKMRHRGIGILHFRDSRLVLEIDSDLSAYYRWLVGARMPLLKPSHGTHITITVGVDASKYDNQEVSFEYSHFVRVSGDTTDQDRSSSYYFLDVWCQELLDIRNQFRLPTNFKLHLTIGRTYYE